MAYTTVDNPELYFQTLTWSGNDSGTSRAFTFDSSENMQPDFVWMKIRTGWSADHNLFDSVRGTGKNLHSNSSEAEGTNDQYGYVSSFDTNGFTGSNGSSGANPRYYYNENGGTYVAWNWKAGTSFTNDASATGIGTIDSTGSFNNDNGFSIVSYTGTGSNGTIKHGLSSIPKMIITKKRSASQGWHVQHASLGATKELYLNTTDAAATGSTPWNDTTPTASVFSVGTSNGTNGSSATYIAYCFAEKQGFSRMGSYVGNGSSSGSYIHLGFKPAWLLVKQSSAAGEGWLIFDSKRLGYNGGNSSNYANSSATEASGGYLDLLSNGFKAISTNGVVNTSGATYIYMAFAENPFVTSTGVPATAR